MNYSQTIPGKNLNAKYFQAKYIHWIVLSKLMKFFFSQSILLDSIENLHLKNNFSPKQIIFKLKQIQIWMLFTISKKNEIGEFKIEIFQIGTKIHRNIENNLDPVHSILAKIIYSRII